MPWPPAAGDLPCRWVVHTVGPNRHRGQTDPALLASCFTRSLEVAREAGGPQHRVPGGERRGLRLGPRGGGPGRRATVRAECAAHDGIDLVRFVLFGDRALAAFEAALADRS